MPDGPTNRHGIPVGVVRCARKPSILALNCSTSSGHTARVTHSHKGTCYVSYTVTDCHPRPCRSGERRSFADVKLCGTSSKKGRDLSPGRSLAEAVPLYESVPCLHRPRRPWHPPKVVGKVRDHSGVSGKARMGLCTATFITIARTRWPHKF